MGITCFTVATLLPMAGLVAITAKGYQMAMTVLALIGTCMFLFCFATVRERTSGGRPMMSRKTIQGRGKRLRVRILLLTLCNVRPGFIRMAPPCITSQGNGPSLTLPPCLSAQAWWE